MAWGCHRLYSYKRLSPSQADNMAIHRDYLMLPITCYYGNSICLSKTSYGIIVSLMLLITCYHGHSIFLCCIIVSLKCWWLHVTIPIKFAFPILLGTTKEQTQFLSLQICLHSTIIINLLLRWLGSCAWYCNLI